VSRMLSILSAVVLPLIVSTAALGAPPHFEGFESAAFTSNTAPNWNDYNSVLTRVPSGTNGIASKSGAFHAVMDSSVLPAPPNDFTGAFTRLGGYSSVFPATGFKASQDVFMNLSDPAVLADTYGWDLSCAASDQGGSFLRDFVFHSAGSPGQILVGGSNNSNFTRRNDLGSINHYTITATGWYTFEWVFRNNGFGVLAVDLNLRNAGGGLLWTETRSDPSDLIATIVGGNRYMWFTFLEVNRLAIDNTRLFADNSLSLDIINPKSCYKVGDQICTQLNMSHLTQNVTGFQAFLQYDNSLLTFNPGSSTYTSSPFPVHIQSMSGAEVSPGQINLDGSAPPVGPGSGGTNVDSLLATLCFTVNAGNDGASTDFSFRTVPSFNSELSFQGSPVPTALLDSGSFSIDQTPPSITCPNPVTVNCPSQVPAPAQNLAQFLTLPGAAASDDCGLATVEHVSDVSAGNCQTGNVVITRTYQATDIAGNTSTCPQTITVLQDSTPPLITALPPTKFLDCPEDVPAPYTTVAQFISDGGAVTDTCNMTISLYQSFESGTCPKLIVRIYRIYDECGNYSTFKDVIIVDDNTPPTINGSNTSTQVNASCEATASLSATVHDNCGVLASNVNVSVSTDSNATYGAPVITKTQVDPKTVTVSISVPVSSLTGCPAVVTAMISATDACANSVGPVTLTASVTDAINPTIVCSIVGGAVDGTCQKLVTYGATINDNCCVLAGNVTVNVTPSGSAVFGIPNTTITQNSANQVSVSGSILVSNLTACPATITLSVDATDCCANPAATCSQSANVFDNTPPSITCPPNVNVFADAGECVAHNVSIGSPTVLDNCDGSPTVVGVRSDAQLLNAPYPSGPTTITWTVTDDCTNSNSCVQTVTVQPKNLISATIELKGVVLTSPKIRCIRFIPRNGPTCGASVNVPITFSGGVVNGAGAMGIVSGSDLQIDCGVWTSMCAKDEQHTLSDSVSLVDLGVTYQAAAPFVLLGGDTDNDNDVDINDVTLFISQFGTLSAPNTCPWDGVRDADFSNNGARLAEDYTFLSDNWQLFRSCCGGPGWPLIAPPDGGDGKHPLDDAAGTTRPVLSLRTANLPPEIAESAEQNGDGVIDAQDVAIFEQKHGLDGSLSRSMRSAAPDAIPFKGAAPTPATLRK
jgi:hypothetical protein